MLLLFDVLLVIFVVSKYFTKIFIFKIIQRAFINRLLFHLLHILKSINVRNDEPEYLCVVDESHYYLMISL